VKRTTVAARAYSEFIELYPSWGSLAQALPEYLEIDFGALVCHVRH